MEAEHWILIVEDNPDDEMLARRTMQKAGRQERVVVARDGEEALQMLRTGDPPQLVLLDLKLPRLSGIEVLTEVRDDGRLCGLPIVVLTSSNEISDLNACYGLGCNAFVRKPVDYDEYVHHLSITLNFWLDVNSTPIIDSPSGKPFAVSLL